MKRKTMVALIVLLTAIDQLSKYLVISYLKPIGRTSLVPKVLSFVYVENKGIAFGMFQGSRWPVILLTSVVIIAVLFMALKPVFSSRLFQAGMIMVAAGGIGNFIDRASRVYVVDFIHFHPLFDYVFNLADIFVNIGVFLTLIYLIFFDRKAEVTLPGEEETADE